MLRFMDLSIMITQWDVHESCCNISTMDNDYVNPNTMQGKTMSYNIAEDCCAGQAHLCQPLHGHPKRLIPRWQVCDGHQDCPLGDDEHCKGAFTFKLIDARCQNLSF